MKTESPTLSLLFLQTEMLHVVRQQELTFPILPAKFIGVRKCPSDRCFRSKHARITRFICDPPQVRISAG